MQIIVMLVEMDDPGSHGTSENASMILLSLDDESALVQSWGLIAAIALARASSLPPDSQSSRIGEKSYSLSPADLVARRSKGSYA